MFYFFASDQTSENANHHKGLLFEDLLRKHLDANGFDVTLSRVKANSLEYDIVGAHRIDLRPVIGEAKARADSISGEILAAFIGKLVPFQFSREGGVTGLFLSTSPLTPDAEDYLGNLTSTTPFRVSALTGSDLQHQVRTSLGLPSDQAAANAVAHVISTILGTGLLHTDVGSYVLAIGASAGQALPDRFALVAKNGSLVSDTRLLDALRESDTTLRDLTPVSGASTSVPAAPPRAMTPPGIILGTSWVDFRHPAGPSFFVGRVESLSKARTLIEQASMGVVLEIKARSGVGKSSLLATLADEWTSAGARVELHDARDVHSPLDLFGFARRFLQSSTPITTLEALRDGFFALDKSLDRRAYFLIDQFESTFASPEVFRAYEFLALCVAKSCASLVLVFARKDDLLTTHDDARVSIERLRQVSTPIPLDDFPQDEAVILVEKIAQSRSTRLRPEILTQVLEFARGFPWLLRRTMAHVLSAIDARTSQQELISSGLHLADLFQEELDELDELDRGYLVRIAAHLPATYHVLLGAFEGDPQMARVLERLTARRVLRFSAGTYDTYNDVFKDYLLYGKLQERSHSALLRMGPVPIMRAFRSLGGSSRIDPQVLGKQLGKSLTGTYNILRELRLAGLVSRKSDGWVVPQIVRDFEHQGRLGEYVRQSLLKNGAVSSFLARLDREGAVALADVVGHLRQQFPFTTAKMSVWTSYERTFLSWLSQLELIELLAGDRVTKSQTASDKAVESLGNLVLGGRGFRSKQSPFLPQKELSVVLRVLGRLQSESVPRRKLSRVEGVAISDLLRLNAVYLAQDGTITARLPCDDFVEHVRRRLEGPTYQQFWQEVVTGKDRPDAIGSIFGVAELARSTREVFADKLVSWGKTLGFLPRRRLSKGTPG